MATVGAGSTSGRPSAAMSSAPEAEVDLRVRLGDQPGEPGAIGGS